MLAAPIATSRAHAALHFIENEEDIVRIGNFPQLLQPFAAEMVIATLALDWLDNDGADVDLPLADKVVNLAFSLLFPFDHIGFAL